MDLMHQHKRDVDSVVEIYRKEYLIKKGKSPLILTKDDTDKLSGAISRHGLSTIKDLIKTYLQLDGQGAKDTWYKDNGHSIGVFVSKIAAIHGASAAGDNSGPLYVIGFTNGYPVAVRDPKKPLNDLTTMANMKFEPVLLTDWLKLPNKVSRLQGLDWGDTHGWETIWKEMYPDLNDSA